MNRTWLWAICVAAALACVLPAEALTLTGNTSPSPSNADLTPNPSLPGYNSYATAHEAQVLSAGRNSGFEAAFNQVISGEWSPVGWSLQWSSDPIDAVLNVSTYRAYNYKPGDPQYGSFYAGAEMRIEWTPSPEQQSMRWIQAINTNRPRSTGQWYLDIFRLSLNQPPAYPYQYPDYHFYDMPSRPPEADEHIFWDGYLYLADINRASKVVTMYEGIYWGWSVDTVVPEPASLAVLIGGLGWTLAAAVHRQRGRPGLEVRS